MFIIIPIILQSGFIVGKTVGYNEHEQRLVDKTDFVYKNENKSSINKSLINKFKILDKLNFEKEIKIFFYDLELRYNGIDVTNRSFSLIFKSETILKISFFYLFIYFFFKKIFLNYF